MPRLPKDAQKKTYNKPAKNISAAISEDIAKKFNQQARERGFQIQRATEGAARLWITLSAEEQAGWISGHKPKRKTAVTPELRQLASLLRQIQQDEPEAGKDDG